MKRKSRIFLLTILSICTSFLTFAQNAVFYASLDDYTNKKPIPGYEIIFGSWQSYNFGEETFKVKTATGTEKKKISELPSAICVYNGRSGERLLRLEKGMSYIILVIGKKCYYSAMFANEKQFYSETYAGELKKFILKEFKIELEKYGMLDAYNKDRPKREFGSNQNDFFNEEISRNVKYITLLNEKMK